MRASPWRALLLKELLALRPMLAIALMPALIYVILALGVDPPDTFPLARTFRGELASDGMLILHTLLAFGVAQGLLVLEHDDGTLAFLDALPISRWSIFTAKVCAAWAVILALPLSLMALFCLLHGLSVNSIYQGQPWARDFAVLGLDYAVAGLFGLSLGLALSYLRTLAWAGLFFCWALYAALEPQHPALALLSPVNLPSSPFSGFTWLLPGRALALQSALSIALLAASYGLFLGGGRAVLASLASLRSSRSGRFIWGTVMFALLVGGTVLFVRARGSDEEDEADGGDRRAPTLTFTDAGEVRAHTRSLELVFNAEHAARAAVAVQEGDAVASRVRQLLGAPPGDPITVDMRGSGQIALGQAHWGKLTLDLAALGTPREVLGVLAHELAHVYIDRVSERRLTDQFNSARFFHEGLAEVVRSLLLGDAMSAERRAIRAAAALKLQRDLVSMATLTDDRALVAQQDPEVVYILGPAFVEATLTLYGPAALPRILIASREPSLRELSGEDLWRAIYQLAGLSYDDAVSRMFADLVDDGLRLADLLEGAPPLTGAVEVGAQEILVDPIDPQGEAILCRFRPDAEAPPHTYRTAEAKGRAPCVAQRAWFPEGKMQVQLGYWPSPGEGRPAYGAWQSVTLGGGG